MRLENKTIKIIGGSYGSLWLWTFDKNEQGQLYNPKKYKFNGFIENANIQIYIPPGCRKDYAQITKINK